MRASDATIFDFLRLALLASPPEDAPPALAERRQARAL